LLRAVSTRPGHIFAGSVPAAYRKFPVPAKAAPYFVFSGDESGSSYTSADHSSRTTSCGGFPQYQQVNERTLSENSQKRKELTLALTS